MTALYAHSWQVLIERTKFLMDDLASLREEVALTPSPVIDLLDDLMDLTQEMADEVGALGPHQVDAIPAALSRIAPQAGDRSPASLSATVGRLELAIGAATDEIAQTKRAARLRDIATKSLDWHYKVKTLSMRGKVIPGIKALPSILKRIYRGADPLPFQNPIWGDRAHIALRLTGLPALAARPPRTGEERDLALIEAHLDALDAAWDEPRDICHICYVPDCKEHPMQLSSGCLAKSDLAYVPDWTAHPVQVKVHSRTRQEKWSDNPYKDLEWLQEVAAETEAQAWGFPDEGTGEGTHDRD